jgi:hypothetical protein
VTNRPPATHHLTQNQTAYPMLLFGNSHCTPTRLSSTLVANGPWKQWIKTCHLVLTFATFSQRRPVRRPKFSGYGVRRQNLCPSVNSTAVRTGALLNSATSFTAILSHDNGGCTDSLI